MSDHTPTPWSIDGEHLRALVRGADGTIVALRHRLPATTHIANVEFIVRAVNAHDDLIAALKEADEWLDASLGLVKGDGPPNWDGIREHRKAISAALAKAESPQ